MDVGGVHLNLEQGALRVDEHLTLAPGDLLAAVIAAWSSGRGRLRGLAVDDGGRGLGRSAEPRAVPLAQSLVDALPGAVSAPLGEVVIHRAPGWVFVGQQTPLCAGAEQVEHGTDDVAQFVGEPAPDFALPGQNVWPAPSASGFDRLVRAVCINVSGLPALPLAKMEIRAFQAS
jgi:hypothetical protein